MPAVFELLNPCSLFYVRKTLVFLSAKARKRENLLIIIKVTAKRLCSFIEIVQHQTQIAFRLAYGIIHYD